MSETLPTILSDETAPTVTQISEETFEVIFASQQGPPGAQGIPGPSGADGPANSIQVADPDDITAGIGYASYLYADIDKRVSQFNVTGVDSELAVQEWTGDVWRVGTKKTGAGVARAMSLITDDANRLTIGAAGGIRVEDGNQLVLPATGFTSPALTFAGSLTSGIGFRETGFVRDFYFHSGGSAYLLNITDSFFNGAVRAVMSGSAQTSFALQTETGNVPNLYMIASVPSQVGYFGDTLPDSSIIYADATGGFYLGTLWTTPMHFGTNNTVQMTLGSTGGLTLLSGQMLLPDGSAALPSIAAASAPTTGIYFGSDNINFATMGVVRWQMTANAGNWIPTTNAVQSIGTSSFHIQNLHMQGTLRNYNPNGFTDSSNYESFDLVWGGNVATLRTFQVGTGVPRSMVISAGTVATPATITLTLDATARGAWSATGLQLKSDVSLAWSSSTVGGTSDTILLRDGANILAQRNSTTSQAFRLYGTYTDSSNYERGVIGWGANIFRVQIEQSGTGVTTRSMAIGTSGAGHLFLMTATLNRWAVSGTDGGFYPQSNNAYDIGTSTTVNAPRSIYVGTSFNAPAGTAAAPSVHIGTDANQLGLFRSAANTLGIAANGIAQVTFSTATFAPVTNAAYDIGTAPLKIKDIFHQGARYNYAEWIDASNYARLREFSNSTDQFLLMEALGTGVARDLTIGTSSATALQLRTSNTLRWSITSAGNIIAGLTNTYDIGTSLTVAAPRTIYAGTSMVAPVFSAAGTALLPGFTFSGDLDTGIYSQAADTLGFSVGGNLRVRINSTGILLQDQHQLRWRNAADNAYSVSLINDADNVLAQRNGTTAQAFRVYNTFTDASNYERGEVAWSGNVFRVGTTNAGTGTGRVLRFMTGGVDMWTISATGTFFPSSNATADIGTTSAHVRHAYMQGSWFNYGAFTDTSNYERGFIEWASTIFRIGTEKLGTGTARAMSLVTDGTSRWLVGATTGDLTPNGTGVYSFGSAASRALAGYFGGSTVTASTPMLDLDQTWNNGAVAFTAMKINAANTASLTTSKLLDLLANSISRFAVRRDGIVEVLNGQALRTNVAGGTFFFDLGIVTFRDGDAGGVSRVNLGGTTSAFPALKRNGAQIDARLADDSAFCVFRASALRLGAGTTLTDPVDGSLRIMDVAGTGGGFVESKEIADPSAPAANEGRLYFRDNGAGKTQLCVRFATGAVQVVATEP